MSPARIVLWALVLSIEVAHLDAQSEDTSRLPTFADVTTESGIGFKHSFGDLELTNIVEATGAGACFFDFNNDGNLDLYVVNGAWNEHINDNRGRKLKGKLSNRLYRGNGNGTFEDVTEKANGFGCSAADADNDGDLDLYVLNYGSNVLFRNEGDGTFVDDSEASGLADGRMSLSAPWLDYDNDGDLDVYVANYLEYDEGAIRAYYAADGYPGLVVVETE